MAELVVQNFEHVSGFAAKSVPVTVVGRDTDTLVELYATGDESVTKTNPLVTDGVGNVSFYAPLGSYDYLVLGTRIPFDVEDPTPAGDDDLLAHINAAEPHPAYDVTIPSLTLLFENGLV